jgi:MFS family permease
MAIGMREIPQFAFFLIYLQEQLGLAPVTISSVVAGAQIAGMATALLGGAITARLGRKRVLVCGLVLSGLSSLAFQMPLPGLVPFVWILSGAGGALVAVGGASYLTRISAQRDLGILAAFYAMSLTIGGAIGNPIAGLIIERYGFVAFSWAAIALSTGTILVVTLFMTHIQDHAPEPVSMRSTWLGVLSTARQTNVRLLVGLRCLPTIFYGMLTVLIPLLINDLTGSKVMVAAYGTTTLIVASAAQLLAGRSSDRWGARLPTLAAYAAILLSGLGLAASSGTVWGLFVFGVLGIAAAWSLSTLMYVWVNDGVPKAEHPSTFGLLHAMWSLSMISGSFLGSWFVSLTPGLPFLAAGLLNIGSFFLIWSYYNRSSVKGAVSRRQNIRET